MAEEEALDFYEGEEDEFYDGEGEEREPQGARDTLYSSDDEDESERRRRASLSHQDSIETPVRSSSGEIQQLQQQQSTGQQQQQQYQQQQQQHYRQQQQTNMGRAGGIPIADSSHGQQPQIRHQNPMDANRNRGRMMPTGRSYPMRNSRPPSMPGGAAYPGMMYPAAPVMNMVPGAPAVAAPHAPWTVPPTSMMYAQPHMNPQAMQYMQMQQAMLAQQQQQQLQQQQLQQQQLQQQQLQFQMQQQQQQMQQMPVMPGPPMPLPGPMGVPMQGTHSMRPMGITKTRPCHSFANGRCNRGDACKYSHDPQVIRRFLANAVGNTGNDSEGDSANDQPAAKVARRAHPSQGNTSQENYAEYEDRESYEDEDGHDDGRRSEDNLAYSDRNRNYNQMDNREDFHQDAPQFARNQQQQQQQQQQQLQQQQQPQSQHPSSQESQQSLSGNAGAGVKPTFTSKVIVINIPEQNNNVSDLSGHFSKFGKIINIQLGVDAAGAPSKNSSVIEFSTPKEAQRAKTSEEAVFGSRFVQVHYAVVRKSATQRLGPVVQPGAPASSTSNGAEGNATGNAESAQAPAPAAAPVAAPAAPAAPLPKPMTKFEMAQAELKKVQEVLTKAVELRKEQHGKVEKYLNLQKLLVSKLEDKSLAPDKKAEFVQLFKSYKGLIEETKKSIDTSNIKITELQKQRDSLAAIVHPKRPSHPAAGPARTGDEQSDAAATSLRGRGRGRGARGRGRGRGGWSQSEGLTTVLQVKGFDPDTKESFYPFFAAVGNLLNIFVEGDGSALITFKDRTSAENAFAQAKKKYTNLSIEWFELHSIADPTPPSSTSNGQTSADSTTSSAPPASSAPSSEFTAAADTATLSSTSQVMGSDVQSDAQQPEEQQREQEAGEEYAQEEEQEVHMEQHEGAGEDETEYTQDQDIPTGDTHAHDSAALDEESHELGALLAE